MEETERVFADDDNGGQHEGRDDMQKAFYNIHLYPVISKGAPIMYAVAKTSCMHKNVFVRALSLTAYISRHILCHNFCAL